MAIYFPSSGHYIYRTTQVLSLDTSLTLAFWLKLSAVAGGTSRAYLALGGAVGYVRVESVAGAGDDLVLSTKTNGGATASTAGNYTLTLEVWTHVAVTYNSSTHDVVIYKNAANATTLNTDLTGVAPTLHYLGYSSLPPTGAAFALACCRSWQAVLTTTELLEESRSSQAVRISNLFMDAPLLTASTGHVDLSGLYQAFTSTVGTPTTQGSPSLDGWRIGRIEIRPRREEQQ